jgi:hypothetical protein
MTALKILADGGLLAKAGSAWQFGALLLLILFVTLAATEGSRNDR